MFVYSAIYFQNLRKIKKIGKVFVSYPSDVFFDLLYLGP